MPFSEPLFLFLRTESRPTTKWLSQLTQARGVNTCSPPGGNEHYLPSPFLPTASDFMSQGRKGDPLSLSRQDQDSFLLTRPPAWPQRPMQPSRAAEMVWETGWIYFLPSQQSALRMCTSMPSFPSQRPGDKPDGQRYTRLSPLVKIQSRSVGKWAP